MSLVVDPSVFDVAIVGGGPAGLSAALALGRGCRRVAIFDAGVRRNAAASQIHNFVTRDGTAPSEFREIAQQQLARYATVELRADHVTSISGERDAFTLATVSGALQARRVILCTGMIDEMLDLLGFREAWGHSIYQRPYCHGWEIKDRRWGYLALDPDGLTHGFPAMLKGWTHHLTVFSGPGVDLPDEAVQGLVQRGIAFESSPVAGLVVEGQTLTHVELATGERVACDALFAHPPQRHVDLVRALDLALDPQGYVEADAMTRQTSVPGIYAAGDLTTRARRHKEEGRSGFGEDAQHSNTWGRSAKPALVEFPCLIFGDAHASPSPLAIAIHLHMHYCNPLARTFACKRHMMTSPVTATTPRRVHTSRERKKHGSAIARSSSCSSARTWMRRQCGPVSTRVCSTNPWPQPTARHGLNAPTHFRSCSCPRRTLNERKTS